MQRHARSALRHALTAARRQQSCTLTTQRLPVAAVMHMRSYAIPASVAAARSSLSTRASLSTLLGGSGARQLHSSHGSSSLPTPPWPTTTPVPAAPTTVTPSSSSSSSSAASSSTPGSSDPASSSDPSIIGGSVDLAPSSIELDLQRAVPFNTYELVTRLRDLGLDEPQSVAVMKVFISAQDSILAKLVSTYRSDLSALKSHTDTNQTALKVQMVSEQTNLLSIYRAELSGLKEQMNEKIFNASLKTDMQAKFARDNFKLEIDAIKADMSDSTRQITAVQAQDRLWFQRELDKEVALLAGLIREAAAASQKELEKKQNDVLRFFLGLFVSLGALVLAAIRLLQ